MVVVDIYTAGRAHFSSVRQHIRRIAIRSYSVPFVVAHIITTLTDDWIVYYIQGAISIARIVGRGTSRLEIGTNCLNIAGNLRVCGVCVTRFVQEKKKKFFLLEKHIWINQFCGSNQNLVWKSFIFLPKSNMVSCGFFICFFFVHKFRIVVRICCGYSSCGFVY